MKLCFTKVLGDVRAAFLSKPKEPSMSIHLLQRITDVTRRSRWAHFAEATDLHLADLKRQAEEHHRDRKPPPLFQETTRAVTEAPSVKNMAVRLVLVHHMKHPLQYYHATTTPIYIIGSLDSQGLLFMI